MPAKHRPPSVSRRTAHLGYARSTNAAQAVQTQRRLNAALQRVVALTLQEQPLQVVLQVVVHEISAATGLPIVAIAYYEPTSQLIEVVAATGMALPGGQAGRLIPASLTIAGRAAHSGQAILTAHAHNGTADVDGILDQLGAQTAACLPMATAEGVIGILVLAHPDAVVIDAAIVPLVQSLAHVIATLVAHRRALETNVPAVGQGRDALRDAGGTTALSMAKRLDVTERKWAEEQLHESRIRLELALKGANLGMWDWEVQTGRAVFNERWATIVGYTLAELEPLSFRTWERLCHPDDLERATMLQQQHVAGETAFYECEVRMRHKDGSWIWISSRGQVVERDAAGNPLRMAGIHLDITERKRAEEQLRELNLVLERHVAERTVALRASQDRLSLATHSAGIGIWDWDIAANVLTWDERMYELYGVTPATFGSAYETWFKGLHPDDRAEAERISLRSRRGEQEYDTEFRVCHPDGAVRVLKAHAFIQRGPDGEALRMTGVNFDITERRQAEEQLRLSEQRYRTLLEHLTQGVIVFQDRRVVFCNEAITSIVGCSVAELLGSSDEDLAELLKTDDTEGLHIDLVAWMPGVSVFTMPSRMYRAVDGVLRWVITDITATSYNGRPATLLMLSDVTALKLVEEQLRLSEARMQLLLSKVPAVIFSALAEGDFHTTFISESVRTVLGYEPAQFMGLTGFWADCIHPEDRAQVFGDVPQLLAQGWRQYEYRCRHADGGYRWVENGVSLLPANAIHPAEVVGYFIDITARKQAEEILRQANRDMAYAARMKDEFLANMSHELRSPLNAILGFSEGLQDAVYGQLSERQQKALRHIETSGRHLLALINDILDLSKIEAGKMTIAIETVRIIDVCQASLLFVKEQALKKALRLELQLSDPTASLEADPRRLKQILVNLLANAVKFTPDGGAVSLAVVLDAAVGVVRFAVCDTGIGIAPEHLAQLFQPFVQLDSSLSRQHAGTGLGLALVRRMAELHGGRVIAESVLGQGSCFTLIIPRYPPAPGVAPLYQDGDQPALVRDVNLASDE